MSPIATGPTLRDVTLRDGLQLTGKPLDTDRKLSIIRALIDIGVPELEIGSMARADLVPALADTLQVVAELTEAELARCWVWTATPRHVEKAAAAGVRNFQYCLSASDAHNHANIGRSTEASLATAPDAIRIAADVGGRIQLCIATAFTCPFDGLVPADRVVAIASDERTSGMDDIVLCDTLGQAVPFEVTNLIERVRHETPARRIVFHGHDTWGMGVANTLAAISAGARMVDGCLGGLGGCPFAPGASGNTATEDILFALRPSWFTPSSLEDMVELSEALLKDLGEPMRAKAVQGARSEAREFPWVFGPR